MAVSYLVRLPIMVTPSVHKRVVNSTVNGFTTKIEMFQTDTVCVITAEVGDPVVIEAYDVGEDGTEYKLGSVISFTASAETGEIVIGEGIKEIAPPEVVTPVVEAEAVVVPVEPEPQPETPAPDETLPS